MLGREELRLVGHSGVGGVSLSTASEGAPRRPITPPRLPYPACLGRSLSGNIGGLVSVLSAHSRSLEV